MVEQREFQEDVKQWVAAMNEVVANLREEISEIALAQEEDMFTIAIQYELIKDLRHRINQLEYSLKQRKEVKYGRNIS